MTGWIRIKAAAAGIALTAAAFTAAPANAKGVLKVADADWTGGVITCRLIEFIIRDWGYKVQRISMASGPAVLQSVRNEEVDFGCEQWPSYSKAKNRFIRKFGGDGSVVYLGEVGIVGQGGYYIPRYLLRGDKRRKIKAQERASSEAGRT